MSIRTPLIASLLCLVGASGTMLNGECVFASRLVAPQYPLLGLQSHTQGTVEIEVVLNKDDSVLQVRALSGSKVLSDTAVKNAQLWRFARCLNENRAGKTAIRMIYKFVLFGVADYPKSYFTYEHPFIVTVESQAQQANP